MTSQPSYAALPLIPRPEMTFKALRQALAQVAPHRLDEMRQQQEDAATKALESGDLTPLRAFLRIWAANIEIARFPETAARLRAAEHAVQTLDKSAAAWREAMDDMRRIFDAAEHAVDA